MASCASARAVTFFVVFLRAAAFVAFLRIFVVAFEGVHETWANIVWWLAAVTMIVANLIALVQSNVKRMLAYSSIAHGGYLHVAITAANETAGWVSRTSSISRGYTLKPPRMIMSLDRSTM